MTGKFNTGNAGRSGRGATIVGIALLLTTLGVLAGVGLFVMRVRSEPQPDPLTLCPANGPNGHLVTVLDLTDPLSSSQAANLRSYIDTAVAESPVGTMISVGTVGEGPAQKGTQFALCKPMSGAEASELYQNPKQIEKRFGEGFQEPLDRALDAMISGEPAERSPIMEGIQAVLADTPGFSRGAERPEQPRRLIVASDLIQNSDVMSFYRGEDWADFERSQDFGRLAGNLQDVEVLILKVPRPSANIRDPEAIEDFWARYFDHQGAKPVRKRVLGDL